MSGEHLTEEMLQQYALNPGECPDETLSHLFECAECRAEVAAYEQLRKALKEQPAPAFEFDLAAAVMAQLDSSMAAATEASLTGRPDTVAAEEASNPRPIARLLIPLIALLVAVPAWFFWKPAYYVFSAMSAGLTGIILGFAGIAVLLSVYKYYRKYQQVLHLINS